MPELEMLNQVFQIISSFGVSGIFIWQALRMERKYDEIRVQYIADLREIAGLRHQLHRNPQASYVGSGNGEKLMQFGQTKTNGD